MRDGRIKLRHLDAFVETVRQGGVAAAGAALHTTQPAVSKSIAELEAVLGVALFDRSRRALALTADGEMFLRYAEAGLGTLQQGVETLAETRSGASAIAFGALPSVSASVVPQALARFAASSFACRVLVESGPSPYLLELLRRSAIAFVVGRMARPEAMEGLSFEYLYSEELALVVRAGHPLARANHLTLGDLATYPFVLPPRQAIIRGSVDALLIAGGLPLPANAVETVSNSLGRSLALTTDAIWIISRGVVRGDIAAGQLHRLAIDVSATVGAVGITARSGIDQPMPVRAMLDFIRQSADAADR